MKIYFSVIVLLFTSNTAFALIYNAGDLNFSTTNQSLWDGGPGIVPKEVTYNLDLDSDLVLGGITGSSNQVIISGYTKEVYNPFKNWHCHERAFGECVWGEYHGGYDTITIDPVRADTRFGTEVKLSTRGNVLLKSDFGVNGGTVDASVDYSDVELEIPDSIEVGEFFNLNPSSTVKSQVTTKTPNLQGSITSSIDFSVDYSAKECLVPGLCSSSSGNIFDIPSSTATVLEVNTDNLDPDKARVLEIDEILGFDATFDATAVNLSADVYLLPVPGVYLSGLPLLPQPQQGIGVNVLELLLDAPGRISKTGDLNGVVDAQNRVNDVVRLDYDLDVHHGIPTGAILKTGGLKFKGDVLDVDLTPTIDFNQDIGFTTSLMVELQFSQPVLIKERQIVGQQFTGCEASYVANNGTCFKSVSELRPFYKNVKQCQYDSTKLKIVCSNTQVLAGYRTVNTLVPVIGQKLYAPIYDLVDVQVTSLTAPWDDLPTIALINDDELSVQPKFWIQNQFTNKSWFDYDINVALSLLKGSIDFSILSLWDDCLYCNDFLVANLGDFGQFDKTFMLNGFDDIYSEAFSLRSRTSNYSGQVSEPSILWLLSFGLISLLIKQSMLFRRKR